MKMIPLRKKVTKMNKYINNLYNHSLELIYNKKLMELNENILLFKEILKESIIASEKPHQSKTINEIVIGIEQIAILMMENDYEEKMFDYIVQIYKIVHEVNSKKSIGNQYHINIIKPILIWISKFKEKDFISTEIIIKFNSILYFLIVDMSEENWIGKSDNISLICTWLYSSIFENGKISEKEKENLLKNLIDNIINLKFYISNENKSIKIDAYKKAVLLLIKILIDKKDKNNYSRIISYNKFTNK